MWFKILLFIIQFSALVAAIYYWKDYYKTEQKYFLFIIAFAILVDFFTGIISVNINKRYNLLFNTLTIVSILFYMYWFFKILKKNKIILLFVPIFVITIIYSLINQNIIWKFYGTLLLVGTIIILLCSTLYFISIIKTNKVITYIQSQRFWIVTGLLVFHIGYLPMHLFLPIIKADSLEFKIPMIILNIFLYGCYIISFKVAKYNVDE